MNIKILAPAAALSMAAFAAADVRLPSVLSDNMVLQRHADVAIWGWADPGEAVSVVASWDAEANAVADDRGRWLTHLKTPGAGGPHEVTISGENTISLKNVLCGEVWICSGQSNMEWPVARSDRAQEEIASAEHPRIRLLMVPNTFSLHERNNVESRWVECSPQTIAGFSAVGYSFAREIMRELDVPVGLISADWGGTRAEAWTSEDGLRALGDFDDALDGLELLKDPELRPGEADAEMRWWRMLDTRAPRRPADGWTVSDYDDSAWSDTELPGTLSGDGLESFDGLVYFRRVIELPDAFEGEPAILELGPIDDRDETWVNGQLVGGVREDGRWSAPRRYEIPAGVLRAGSNVIAVRMLDTGGPGGINGRAEQMKLSSGDNAVALAGTWRRHVGGRADRLPADAQPPRVNQNTPTVLSNGMLEPVIPFTIRGALWYQGESNRMRAAQYQRLFPAMITDWRRRWGQGDFPFYYVQIAPFNYNGDTGQAASLREAQLLTQLAVPNVGMVSTMDIGDPRDIHPTNKQEVGRRLSLWALAKTYSKDVESYSGPMLQSTSREANAMRLRFDFDDGGLVARGGVLTHFAIAGDDRVFHEADARIDGDSVIVSSPRVDHPVAVRYAWGAADEPNLMNGAGLPASSFRTDDWEGPYQVIRRAPTTDSPPAGFTRLFDGESLDGWVNVNGAPSTWRVEDGMIICSGIPTGVLRTDRHYQNFVLELEWRHLQAGGNAGVFVWSDPITARGQPFTRSIEVQVLDGREGSWFTSDGDIFPIHGATMTPVNGRGSGSRAFPTEKRSNPSPEWNHYRIECVDGSIKLAVNGKVVTQGNDSFPRAGYICLESEGSPIHFRNIYIRELPASTPVSENERAELAQGFVSLYNGVDLDGWKASEEHTGHWIPRDWALAFDGHGPDLWTEKEFGDFELICDWRWSSDGAQAQRPVILETGLELRDEDGNVVHETVQDAGDSGIYLRGSSKSQVNIWCWPVGSGEVYGYRTDGSMPPEVRAGVTPSANADAPIGEWNRFRITMIGDRLTVVLNGTTVIEEARLPGVAPSGPIALQRHGAPLEFANIYIREID